MKSRAGWMTELSCGEEEYSMIEKHLEITNERNQRLFGLTEDKIQRLSAQKFVVDKQERRKAYFDNGWYCIYTDNIDKQGSFVNKNVILTVHGNPGDEVEWRRLETSYSNRGRFINFVIPGYDGESEIRGRYKGSWEEVCKTIVNLLDYLKIPKIIFCGHSMGGFIMYNFGLMYPERCEAFIYMAAPPNSMYIGLTCFDTMVRVHFQEETGGDISKLNDPEIRKKITKSLNETTKDVYFKLADEERSTIFPRLRESEACTWMKMLYGKKPCWEYLHIAKQQPERLKLILFACNDQLVDPESYYITAYDILKRRKIPYSEYGISKEQFSKLLECDINELPDDLQEIFLMILKKGGHQIHVKHAKLIAGLIDKFVKVIDSKYQGKNFPRLQFLFFMGIICHFDTNLLKFSKKEEIITIVQIF